MKTIGHTLWGMFCVGGTLAFFTLGVLLTLATTSGSGWEAVTYALVGIFMIVFGFLAAHKIGSAVIHVENEEAAAAKAAEAAERAAEEAKRHDRYMRDE